MVFIKKLLSKNKKKKYKGNTLAEVVVTLAIISTTMIVTISMAVQSLKLSKDNEVKNTANEITLQALELFKSPSNLLVSGQPVGSFTGYYKITKTTAGQRVLEPTPSVTSKITSCDTNSTYKVNLTTAVNAIMCQQIYINQFQAEQYVFTSVVVYKLEGKEVVDEVSSVRRSGVTTVTGQKFPNPTITAPTPTSTPMAPSPTPTLTPTPTATLTPTPTPPPAWYTIKTEDFIYGDRPANGWSSQFDETWGVYGCAAAWVGGQDIREPGKPGGALLLYRLPAYNINSNNQYCGDTGKYFDIPITTPGQKYRVSASIRLENPYGCCYPENTTSGNWGTFIVYIVFVNGNPVGGERMLIDPKTVNGQWVNAVSPEITETGVTKIVVGFRHILITNSYPWRAPYTSYDSVKVEVYK